MDWITSDLPTWLAIVLPLLVGGGAYQGAKRAAIARARLDDRRELLVPHHFQALKDAWNHHSPVIAAKKVNEDFPRITETVRRLSYVDRVLWARALRHFSTLSELRPQFKADTTRADALWPQRGRPISRDFYSHLLDEVNPRWFARGRRIRRYASALLRGPWPWSLEMRAIFENDAEEELFAGLREVIERQEQADRN